MTTDTSQSALPAIAPVTANIGSRQPDNIIELSPGARYNAPTMLFYGYLFFSLASIVTALALQRPALLGIGAPSLLILIVGLLSDRYPEVEVQAAVDTPRALEGDLTRIWLRFTSADNVGVIEAEMGEVRAFQAIGSQRHVVAVKARRSRTVGFPVVPLDWGLLELPSFTVRSRKATGLFATTIQYRCVGRLRVHINEEPTRSQLEPNAFRRVVGSHVSSERGEGVEIADNRPYQAGDRLQAINWRISARNDEPWVTLRNPDRSTTIVLVIDAFGTFGYGDLSTLRRSVRAAMGLARLHLDAQDPVGLLLTGHGRRWIEPQLGMGHLAAMTDALLELSTQEWGDREIKRQRIERLIPVNSVVIAISPLLNDAFGTLLQPLLGRGQQVHLIEPIYRLPTDILAGASSDNGDPTVAWRVFELEQQLRRRALTAMGASVSPWSSDQPIESTLLTLRRAQRAQLATMRRQR